MKFFCALLLLATVVSGREISFELEKGKKREVAVAIPISEGTLATVAVVGFDAASAGLGLEDTGGALTLFLHDPVSRLTLLKRPEGDEEKVAVLGSAFDLERGDALYLDPEKRTEVSRFVGWENRNRESVFPISLMRVNHPKEQNPAPGTPLYNAAGELVALCREATDEYGHGTYALPAEVITRVQKDQMVGGKVIRCWIGIVMEVKNVVPTIMTVRPESPAAVAGVKTGDVLLSVGKHEVRSYADTVNAFYYLVKGEEAEVSVLRGTEKLTLKVIPEVNPLAKNSQ